MRTVKQIFSEAYNHSFLPSGDVEGVSYLSKVDTRRPAKFPPEKDIPNVLTLVRKAIRVYPDNQKIALYYSQALDKYLSIPYGPDNRAMGIHLSEARFVDDPKDPNYVPPDLANAYLDKIDPKRRKIGREEILGMMKPKEAVRYKGGARSKIKSILQSNQKGTAKFGKILGLGARLMTNKLGLTKEETITGNFKNKLQQIREENIHEVLSVAARIAAKQIAKLTGKKAGKKLVPRDPSAISKYAKKTAKKPPKQRSRVGAFGAGMTADNFLDSLNVGGSSGSSSSISDLFQQRPQGTKFSAEGRANAFTQDKNPSMTDFEWNRMNSRKFAAIKEEKKKRRQTIDFSAPGRAKTASSDDDDDNSSQKALRWQRMNNRKWSATKQQNESTNYDKIKVIAENNTPDIIKFDETEITINNRIAKKIVNLYESLNKDNKEKIRNMLNENASSFKKIINFAIRQ